MMMFMAIIKAHGCCFLFNIRYTIEVINGSTVSMTQLLQYNLTRDSACLVYAITGEPLTHLLPLVVDRSLPVTVYSLHTSPEYLMVRKLDQPK